MPSIKDPLSEGDRKALRERLSDLNDADELLRKMVNAGLDVGDRPQQLQSLRTQILKLTQAFGA
jgi:hypothetical protein